MLGLIAFLMAFCIGIVINQHNGRKEMVVRGQHCRDSLSPG
jgi:hypothetical protein